MTLDALIVTLEQECQSGDPEIDHAQADAALLTYIDDARVTAAFAAIRKWYG
jgi:hypothetical protein